MAAGNLLWLRRRYRTAFSARAIYRLAAVAGGTAGVCGIPGADIRRMARTRRAFQHHAGLGSRCAPLSGISRDGLVLLHAAQLRFGTALGGVGPEPVISMGTATRDGVSGRARAPLSGTLLPAGICGGPVRRGRSVFSAPAETRERRSVFVFVGDFAVLCAVSLLSIRSAAHCVRRERG